MTLRITDEPTADDTLVRIEGRLEGEGVVELDRLCRRAKKPLRLELGALLNVDDVGLGLLRSLIAAGATVSGASPYIRFLIESGATAPMTTHDGNH